jgi:hypothetical protein
MLEFLSSNWVWILLIGGMLFMHLGHGRAHGGHMGCGGHQHSGSGHEPTAEPSASDRPAEPHKQASPGIH